MKTTIQDTLKNIEQEHKIRILYACESGSRAWGFPSPDSDYDVRFIYVKSADSYLSIRNEKDFMNFPLDSELDINGWDLKKTLELIYKSNSVPFEWLQSPIVYYTDRTFATELWTICQSYLCTRTNIHHYLGIARGAMASLDGGEIGIKKLFYVLRPLLSALWCLDKETIAPMNILPLVELMPKELKLKVLSLIDMKSTAKERFVIQLDDSLKLWIDETLEKCTRESKDIEKKYFDVEILDEFFRKTIINYSKI